MPQNTPKQPDQHELSYRAAGIHGAKTLDRENRSLELVISTETPVRMYDWETGDYVPEVLLAKGAIMPKQVPLLDTHDRWSVKTVLGSVRNKRVEDGLVSGLAVFSSVPAAEEALTKYEEGHLTDFSAGYTFSKNAVTRVKKGEKADIGGRTWTGPVNVVTSWTIKEVSCCPIGADAKAKARAAADQNNNHNNNPTHEGETVMPEANERMDNMEKTLGTIAETVGTLATSIMTMTEKQRSSDDADKSIEQMRAAAITNKELVQTKERARIQEIDAAAAKLEAAGYKVEHIRIEAIEKGSTPDAAMRSMMDVVYNTKASDVSAGIRIAVGQEEQEKSRAGAVDGLMIRACIMVDKVKDVDTEFQTMNLLELAKNRCLTYGKSIRGLDQMQIFERALSSSDFDNILADVANKAMLEGFENANETYEVWAETTGRTNDFKDHVFARASEAPSFIAVNPDGGEYKYGSMSDTKETVAVTDFGVLVPFTRMAMVNDDLGALSDIKEKLGVAARRKYGDLIYAVLTGTVVMGDGNNLWDASNHSNYVASGGAPTVARLNTAAAAMATQKDLKGVQNLNIVPQHILSPWALKGTVDNLLTTTSPIAPGSAASPVMNPWSYLKPVYEARLDAASAAAWYLAARKGMTVKLFTLNGNTTPKIDTRFDWATDSLDFKGRITGAAKAMDYRGLYKNAGA